MKNSIQIIGILLVVINFSMASTTTDIDSYLSSDILKSIKNISLNKLLDFEQISLYMDDEFDKARFHYIISHEIVRRMKENDEKFIEKENSYHQKIKSYENKLGLKFYDYVNECPLPSHFVAFENVDINETTIAKDIHRSQANLAKTQFIERYQYYREHLDNYKYHLLALTELYKYKVSKNKDDQISFYSSLSEIYQGIELFHESMNDAGKMYVQRDLLGKVLRINWEINGEIDTIRHREFKYHNDGLLSKLTDKINQDIIFETLFGENEMAADFLEYLFLPGFISGDYSYITEIYYKNDRPATYRFTTMSGYVIGTIYKEFDEKDHLIRETWFKGETSKMLREFTSIFDPTNGGYKLIERDRNGKIIHQEIILSNTN